LDRKGINTMTVVVFRNREIHDVMGGEKSQHLEGEGEGVRGEGEGVGLKLMFFVVCV